MSNLDKSSIVNMENTARYQPRSKLNITFSTADRDSAVFIFNVMKGNKPLLLSSENVIGHIALKHSDGSFVKDTLHFTEPDINGRFEYYIPNDILKREGTVTMQVFISEKGNSNVTVAERIVTFDIEKSIVSQISAETKLQYIVEYDELQVIIANRITDIEDKMANAEDYVSQLEQAREKGLTDIEIAKTDNIKTLNDLADQRLEEINNKANEYSSKFDDDKQYMDDKHQAFKESVLNSEVVTQGESKEWQKYKLTNDDGTTPVISNFDFNNPEEMLNYITGTFYIRGAKNHTANNIISNYGYISIDTTYSSKSVAKLTFIPIGTNTLNDNNIYLCKKNGDWGEWTEIVPSEIETQNSAESRANETLADANQYTDEQITNQHAVLFEGAANGVGTDVILTDDYTDYKFLFISGTFPGGVFTEPFSLKNKETINICKTNLIDTDGNGGGVYELKIARIDKRKLNISNDVFYDIANKTGSGSDANKFTIKYIEGWK